MIQTRFSASRIGELLAGGTGKTASSYVLDLAMQTLGIKDNVTTKEMTHGIVNQINAFDFVVKPLFEEAEWLDEFISINEYCGASPDILISGTPMDVKCPYYIDTFIDQINQPPKKYYAQVQMQMLACKADEGRLCFYLTKPELWGEETITEYPFPIEMRFKIFDYKKDEEMQREILKKVDEYQPKKVQLVSLLESAKIVEEEAFFYDQLNGFAYRKLKECSNLWKLDEVYRVNDKFYYKKDAKV